MPFQPACGTPWFRFMRKCGLATRFVGLIGVCLGCTFYKIMRPGVIRTPTKILEQKMGLPPARAKTMSVASNLEARRWLSQFFLLAPTQNNRTTNGHECTRIKFGIK